MNDSVLIRISCLCLLACGLFQCGPSNFHSTASSDQGAHWQAATSAWRDTMPAILARIKAPVFPERSFFVKNFLPGIDSEVNAQDAINGAIDACAKAGGGTVYLEGSLTCSGPIHLKSNVHLRLEENSKLSFNFSRQGFSPLVKVRWEGTVAYNYSPFIYAYQCENIAITGSGTIDGNSAELSRNWRDHQQPDKQRLRQMGEERIPEVQRVFGSGFLDQNGDGEDDGYGSGEEHWLRPGLLQFYECHNVLLEDFEIKNSMFWTIHPVFCKNVICRNLMVLGGQLNDDGIDPDSCEDVLIEGCYIKTEDDAISIKAGRDQDAWDRPSSKNIIVRNCTLVSGVNSFCIGSEMSGGVYNVFAENCLIPKCQRALNFKSNLDRGGEVQHIYLRNIEIDTCEKQMFIFRMDYHGYRGNNFPTSFSNIYAENIQCKLASGQGFKIVGVAASPIKKVYLRNIAIAQQKGINEVEFAEEIYSEGVVVNGELWSP